MGVSRVSLLNLEERNIFKIIVITNLKDVNH